MDPAQLKFVVVVGQETRNYQGLEAAEAISIMTVSELDEFIAEQEHCPKIVVVSTLLQRLEKYVAAKQVWTWLRCEWGRQELDEHEL